MRCSSGATTKPAGESAIDAGRVKASGPAGNSSPSPSVCDTIRCRRSPGLRQFRCRGPAGGGGPLKVSRSRTRCGWPLPCLYSNRLGDRTGDRLEIGGQAATAIDAGWIVSRLESLPVAGTERAIVDGATNLNRRSAPRRVQRIC